MIRHLIPYTYGWLIGIALSAAGGMTVHAIVLIIPAILFSVVVGGYLDAMNPVGRLFGEPR